MAVTIEYVFKEPKEYISGELGAQYRRLQFLSIITQILNTLDPKEDKEEISLLLSFRSKLREIPISYTSSNGVTLPTDENEVLKFAKIYTDPQLEWVWSANKSLRLEKKTHGITYSGFEDIMDD